jgi:hypothetical protein
VHGDAAQPPPGARWTSRTVARMAHSGGLRGVFRWASGGFMVRVGGGRLPGNATPGL